MEHMTGNNDWDDDAYARIAYARYDPERDELTVRFVDGESLSLAAWRLLRSTTRTPDWTNVRVVDGYHINVPVAAGSGDLGTDETDIPGTTIRAISDPLFAAHMARQAEESARQVGDRLKVLRQARGLTTRQVAERVDMAQQNVSRIEQGRHSVSYKTLELSQPVRLGPGAKHRRARLQRHGSGARSRSLRGHGRAPGSRQKTWTSRHLLRVWLVASEPHSSLVTRHSSLVTRHSSLT